MGHWALMLIGLCGVGQESLLTLSLGYRLATRYRNRSLASEVARVVLSYAFGKKLIYFSGVTIEPKYVASLKVAEKAGLASFDVLELYGHSVRL